MSGRSTAAFPALTLQTIAIIGAGQEGTALAARAAQAGFFVVLEDLMPPRRRAAEQWLASHGGDGGRVRLASTVEEAVREADLAIDFVPDELESKLEIFSLLDRMAPPRTILATPTRVLSIADLASCTYRREHCVGLTLPSLVGEGVLADVEIAHGPEVSAEVIGAVAGFWQALGARVTAATDRAALP